MIDTIWLIPFGMLCGCLGYALCSLMVVSKDGGGEVHWSEWEDEK